MKKHYRTENNCLNCGATISGRYCTECGQENLELKESFWHLAIHSVGHYFHFDSKFFNSIIPLLTKPGYLTKEYNIGRRASHLHPVSMYLFISIVFFFLLIGGVEKKDDSATGKSGIAKTISKEEKEEARKEIAEARELIDEKLSGSAAQTKAALYAHNYLDKSIATVAPELLTDDTATAPVGNEQVIFGFKKTSVEEYEFAQAALPENARDGYFTHLFKMRFLKVWNDEGKSFVEKLLHNLPKMMFILLPLFALILKVAYPKSKKYYIEHLIYSIHVHSFIFLFSSIVILLTLAFPAIEAYTIQFSFVVVCWYIFASLRAVYQNSVRRTIFKFFILSFVYTMLLSASFIVLGFATLMMV